MRGENLLVNTLKMLLLLLSFAATTSVMAESAASSIKVAESEEPDPECD